MRISYKLLFALFLFPLFSSAQSNYKPGYVVTLKGDTLHGFIDYRGWDANPVAISFKTVIGDNKPQKFGISNISFFSVDGFATYQKYTCSISMDETNTAHLGTSRDTSFRIDTVFLKILQKGKNVALYQYTDGLKARFYIGETPGYAPTELIFRLYENVDANGTTVNENTYLKQLFALANKYHVLDDDLTHTLQSANYSETELLPIISTINNISKAEYAKKYAARSKLNFYLSGAVNISSTTSNVSAPYVEGGGGAHTSNEPAISIGVNLIPNLNTDKVELRAEVSVTETQFNSSYQLKVSPYVGVKAAFNQLGISFIPQIIFNFYNTDNFKIYLGAGFNFTHFSYSNASFGSQTPGTSDGGIGESDPYYFNINDNSIMLTAGIKLTGKFEIFVKYFTPIATTQGGYFQLNNNSKQIGLVYFLGK